MFYFKPDPYFKPDSMGAFRGGVLKCCFAQKKS